MQKASNEQKKKKPVPVSVLLKENSYLRTQLFDVFRRINHICIKYSMETSYHKSAKISTLHSDIEMILNNNHHQTLKF